MLNTESWSPSSTLNRSAKTQERCRVYQPHILADALAGSTAGFEAQRLAEEEEELLQTQGTQQEPEDDLQERIRSRRAVMQAEAKAKDEAFRRATERKKQEADAQKEKEFQAMYAEVLAGIDDCAGIMGESQDTLNHRKKIVSEKQRALHQEWHTQVFDKIQGRLDQALAKTSPKETEARLQAQMDDYLRMSNSKPGVFLDVIFEQDYNPMTARLNTIRIPTGDIFDPVKRDWIKAKNERMNMGLSASTSEKLGKDTFDTKMWSEQNVHSTPYGHCVDRTGAYVVHPLSESVLESRKSKVTMDHYDYPNKDNAAAAAELGLRVGKGIPPRPGVPDTRDVLMHQCHHSPGVKKGDIWLEQRGKGHVPAPNAGHVDMKEVLRQDKPLDRTNPGGDEWLKLRGRARVPPPQIAKTGRTDLTEVLTSTSNPYQNGRALDDAWLQKKGKAATHGPKSELAEFINRVDYPPPPLRPRDTRQNMSCLKAEETLHPTKEGPHRFVDLYGS